MCYSTCMKYDSAHQELHGQSYWMISYLDLSKQAEFELLCIALISDIMFLSQVAECIRF